jgi:hypothetical protein
MLHLISSLCVLLAAHLPPNRDRTKQEHRDRGDIYTDVAGRSVRRVLRFIGSALRAYVTQLTKWLGVRAAVIGQRSV